MKSTRRQWIELAALGIGCGWTPLHAAGRGIRTIDMHCHAYVHDVWPLIQGTPGLQPGLADMASGPMSIHPGAIEERLRAMDRQGVETQVMSLHPGQFHYWADAELSDKIVKIQNEKLAEAAARGRGRLLALANLSMDHPELAVEQMGYAAGKLGMRGFISGGRINRDELIQPRFQPIWAKAEQLGLVIFLHPVAGIQGGDPHLAGAGYLDNTIGNPLETTIALAHLIYDGFFDRFAGVKMLAAHGGGYLASYIGRFDNCQVNRPDCRGMLRKPSDYLKGPQLWFDTLVYSPENLRHLLATVGASRLVMGSDFAFDIADREPVGTILTAPGITNSQRRAILGGNAAVLLGL